MTRKITDTQYKYYPPTLIVGLQNIKTFAWGCNGMQHIVREAVVKMKLKKENHAFKLSEKVCVCV